MIRTSRRRTVLGIIAALIQPKIPQLPARAVSGLVGVNVCEVTAKHILYALKEHLKAGGWTEIIATRDVLPLRRSVEAGDWIRVSNPTW